MKSPVSSIVSALADTREGEFRSKVGDKIFEKGVHGCLCWRKLQGDYMLEMRQCISYCIMSICLDNERM